MSTMTQHATGTFCWCQLGTTDPEGAKKFYSSLFGWTHEDTTMGGQSYTVLKKNNKDVGALYKLQKEQRQGGTPSWLSFVAVEDVDRTITQVKQNGGTVLVEPSDILDHGRMAMCQDPTRAVFSLWQARKQIGAGIIHETGSMIWNELITDDAGKAGAFYRQVFGWKEEPMPTKTPTGAKYIVFKKDGTERGVGGMMQATPEMHLTHPYWLIYFAVDDCDQIATKTQQLGGKVVMPANDIPQVGRIAVLNDPQGAWFAILKPDPSM
jgi:uncharacterized protein